MTDGYDDEPRYCLCDDPPSPCPEPVPGFMCRPRKPSPDCEWNHKDGAWVKPTSDLLHRFAVLGATLEGERKAWAHERQELASLFATTRAQFEGERRAYKEALEHQVELNRTFVARLHAQRCANEKQAAQHQWANANADVIEALMSGQARVIGYDGYARLDTPIKGGK